MNKQEFLELQNEFALDVFNFEQFLKTEFLTDARYNVLFFDELLANRKLDVENKLLFDTIKMKENNDASAIAEYISKAKAEFTKERDVAYRKHLNSKVIIEKIDAIPLEKKQEFDDYFKEFVLENNPVVRFNKSKEASAAYELLTRLFRECNIDGFKEVYNSNNKAFLVDKEVPENRYVEFSRLYYETRKKFNSALNQADSHYPFNKIPAVKDEEGIKKEKADLLEKNKSLKDINDNLHKDYLKTFGNDLNID